MAEQKIHPAPNVALTAAQREKLLQIANNIDGLVAIKCCVNLDTEHCDEDMPTGLALLFDPNAVVDPRVISSRLFETLAVSKVRLPPFESTMDEQHFRNHLSVINETIAQRVPQDMAAKLSVRVAGQNREHVRWMADLGGFASFAGVFAKAGEDLRDDQEFYIMARGTAPQVVQDLRKRISKDKPTYGMLVNDPVIVKALDLADRNVCRNMATVASLCSVSIRRQQDDLSHVEFAHEAEPERAAPEWRQVSHHMEQTIFNGEPVVALYYDVVPRETLQRQTFNKPHFVAAGPNDGIAAYHLGNNLVGVDLLPAASGPRTHAQGGPARALTPAELRKRKKNLAWVEVSDDTVRGEYPPELEPNLYASPTKSKEVKQTMKAAGWAPAEHPVQMYVPVAVKIFDSRVK